MLAFFKRKYLISALVIAGFLISIDTAALQVDNFIFIGDSLSDQGNCPIPFFTPPPVTSPGGNTFTYYLSNKFGVADFPVNSNGKNYACVGASTGYQAPFPLDFIKSGLQQVQQAISDPTNFTSHSIFFYWVGSDDILLAPPIATFPEDIYPAFNAVTSVNNVVTGLNMLHNAGARYIIVVNLPALERTPAGITSGSSDYFTEPRAYNQQLLTSLNNLGYRVHQIDLFSVMNYLLDNYQRFGFTNITTPCGSNSALCSTYFFFDDVHPTDKVHRMFADFLYSYLTAPDFVATLAEIPIGMLQAENVKIRQQLFPQQQNREIGKLYPFVAGNVGPYQQNALSPDRINYNSTNLNLTVGLLKQINEEFLLGAAIGQTGSFTNYDQSNSSITTTATTFSLFAGYQKAKFYLNGIINYSRLYFADIDRSFPIGPVNMTANGNTYGNQYGISFASGYNIIDQDNFQFGPLATLDYQFIDVNGYNETGADVFNLVFDKQHNSSFIGGAGLQATFKNRVNNTPLTTNVFLTLNRQFASGERQIFFRQASIAANLAGLPVIEPGYTFASGGINLAATFKHDITASIGYLATIGDFDMRSNMFVVGLTMPL